MKNKKLELTLRVIFRIIALPFLIAIFILSRFRDLILFSYSWVVHGGEVFTYKKNSPQTIEEQLDRFELNLVSLRERIDELKSTRQ